MKETFASIEGTLKECPWHSSDCVCVEIETGDLIKCEFPHGLIRHVMDCLNQKIIVNGLVTEKPGYLHEKRLNVQKLEGFPEVSEIEEKRYLEVDPLHPIFCGILTIG